MADDDPRTVPPLVLETDDGQARLMVAPMPQLLTQEGIEHYQGLGHSVIDEAAVMVRTPDLGAFGLSQDDMVTVAVYLVRLMDAGHRVEMQLALSMLDES